MKKKYEYICSECGYQAYQWLGKCPDCGQWNTLEERLKAGSKKSTGSGAMAGSAQTVQLQKLNDIVPLNGARILTGYQEFDRVLGGGLYMGSTVLLAGEPGIGKSTLLLRAGIALAEHVRETDGTVVYVSAEESQEHIKARADRLGVAADNFFIIAATDLNSVVDALEKCKPAVLIVDSVQALYNADFDAPPGTVTQVRECAGRLCHFARVYGCAVLLVGHVTKEGMLAGPKALEHLVDTVVYFEGDRYDDVRLLRAVKNRHGAIGEIGLFEMKEQGLVEVENPSRFFLAQDVEELPGRATVALIEGRRPFLVEIQALVNSTFFNNPLRRAVGVEVNKVSLLIAVLEKCLALNFSKYDLFVKSTGGSNVKDPAADCALVVAILSSLENKTIPNDVIFIGEIGLGGEIRKTKFLAARIKEAERLGFKTVYVPKGNTKGIEKGSISVVEVSNVAQLYSCLFKGK